MLSFLRKLLLVFKRLAGGARTAVSEPFVATCECGATIAGVRRTSWIEAECQSCFQSVFVLPANVYPATKRVSSSVLSGGLISRLRFVVNEVFPPKEPPPATEEPTPVAAAEAAYEAATTAPVVVAKRSVNPLAALRRTFTPFRLLMLSVMAVIGVTGYWTIHKRAVEAAQQTWIRTSDVVPSLLDERKLTSLETVLQDAVNAGRILGKQDSEWRTLRNLLQETIAVRNVASEDLLTSFYEAYDKRSMLVDGAEANVQKAALSGVYVFDTWLRPDKSTGEGFLIDLPATPGRHRVEVKIALPALQELLETLTDGHLLFAATIQSVTAPESRQADPWKVKLNPESFVLITSTAHCKELGLPVDNDAQLMSMLERQRAFVAESAAWENRNDTITPAQPAVTAENTDSVSEETR